MIGCHDKLRLDSFANKWLLRPPTFSYLLVVIAHLTLIFFRFRMSFPFICDALFLVGTLEVAGFADVDRMNIFPVFRHVDSINFENLL